MYEEKAGLMREMAKKQLQALWFFVISLQFSQYKLIGPSFLLPLQEADRHIYSFSIPF